jgi:hypothetical protein
MALSVMNYLLNIYMCVYCTVFTLKMFLYISIVSIWIHCLMYYICNKTITNGWFMVIYATFNNISVISWRSVYWWRSEAEVHIQFCAGDRPVHKLPIAPKCHELFVILYSIHVNLSDDMFLLLYI